jgi:S-adenosylmethionine synthetase
MPLPIWLAHQLARRLNAVQSQIDELSPDGKTQVAIEYRDYRPARVHSVTLLACQRQRLKPTAERLAANLQEHVIKPVFAELPLRPDPHTRISINPEGPIVPGGPALHAGLTGRKTAVDGYGDFARSGAAALSGKDPSRIDRIGTYAARHVARNVVGAGLADRCEVQISYAIGLPQPVSVLLNTFGTGTLPETELAERVGRVFDLRPAGIVRRFRLRSLPSRCQGAFYGRLAAYGQVGREDMDLPWERLDHVDALRR